MENLQRIDFDGQIVITSKQLAAVYGADSKRISYNFNRNKNRYQEGKHYILLTGQEKKDYINRLEIHDGSDRTKNLYLWTERGALLHAKSLNTDKAWEAYERLVDFYFCQKENVKNQIIEKTNAKNEKYICENPKSDVPAPMAKTWYERNQRKIRILATEHKRTQKTVIHDLLTIISRKYNFQEATKMYEQQLGYPPVYALDVVDFFPEMAEIADEWLLTLFKIL